MPEPNHGSARLGGPTASRRRILGWLSVTALAAFAAPRAAADYRAPTPGMTAGPFYPNTFPPDSDADLTRIEGRGSVAEGSILDVSGRVLDRGGRPRAGARVEIWQCDAHGQYHHVGGPEFAGDPNFQGFGALTTDAEGRYAFRTIRPVPYPGRTPHIHFSVLEGGRRRLTSQMFIEGDPGNERDGLYRYLGREARLVTMRLEEAPAPSGAKLRGALDIVLT
ncbi:MAG TPA: protocatechuate 3,4-dioxygenase [Usitatibacter sp.]|nr:protocatechuate 3,4-dioxygenase [Usitatibacter sp.]